MAAVHLCHLIEELHEHDDLNELTPKMASGLKAAKASLESLQFDLALSVNNQDLAKDSHKLVNQLLDTMPELVPQQFHVASA